MAVLAGDAVAVGRSGAAAPARARLGTGPAPWYGPGRHALGAFAEPHLPERRAVLPRGHGDDERRDAGGMSAAAWRPQRAPRVAGRFTLAYLSADGGGPGTAMSPAPSRLEY